MVNGNSFRRPVDEHLITRVEGFIGLAHAAVEDAADKPEDGPDEGAARRRRRLSQLASHWFGLIVLIAVRFVSFRFVECCGRPLVSVERRIVVHSLPLLPTCILGT